MNAPVTSSTAADAVSETDWRRLHSRVLPNHLALDEFKRCLTDGVVQDQYRAHDLHKIAQEMRDVLREHGELREAACFPVKGKKGELGKALAAAIRVLNHRAASTASPEGGATSVPLGRVAAQDERPPLPRQGHVGAADSARGSANLAVDGNNDDAHVPSVSPDDNEGTRGYTDSHPTSARRPLQRTSGRQPPITAHIDAFVPVTLSPTLTSTLPERTHPLGSSNANGAVPPIATNGTMPPSLSIRIARNASQPYPQDLSSASAPPPMAHPSHRNESAAMPLAASDERGLAAGPTDASSVAPRETLSTGIANELNLLNEYGSPFFQILNVVRRFQIRYGTHQLRFDIPIQYAQAVASRRLRVVIIPFRHPNLPSRWPTAKEIVVYVNDQCVTVPWKRAWPERKEEVAKSFLMLDVTQMLLSRSGVSTTQRLQMDVFTSEFFAPALLTVVQPFSLEEVIEHVLFEATGSSDAHSVEVHLMSLLRTYEASGSATFSLTQPASAPGSLSAAQTKVMASMNETLRFYRSIMEEDVDDGIEVDDPIITTKCPISQLPVRIPIRGCHCRHLQCVDLSSYLMSCSKGCYWNCALCDSALRPRDVRIDTVLWSFLCHFRSQSHSLPHYLRLSVRESPASPTPATAARQYYWHVSRPRGAGADVLIDSSDDEHPGVSAEQEPPVPPQPCPGVESTVGQKRPRTPPDLLPPEPSEGTMDNPIEL